MPNCRGGGLLKGGGGVALIEYLGKWGRGGGGGILGTIIWGGGGGVRM